MTPAEFAYSHSDTITALALLFLFTCAIMGAIVSVIIRRLENPSECELRRQAHLHWAAKRIREKFEKDR